MARNTALCVTLALAALCVVASAARAPRINNVLAPEYQKPVQGNAILCELCDYASNFAEEYLEKNGTEQKVVSARDVPKFSPTSRRPTPQNRPRGALRSNPSKDLGD